MCTLTWGYSPSGYHIHFNRDESRLRARGKPPELHARNGVNFLAPTDPQAQGTWALCNEHGLSACLLNNYIDITPVTGQRSRGLLVKDLGCAKTTIEALERIQAEDIYRYSPFDAFLFDRSGAFEISWNGSKLSVQTALDNFKSSSGFDAEKVTSGRRQQFEQAPKDIRGLRAFHQSHEPDKSAYSVCMHRDDARTQSYTEIVLTASKATMVYSDGPPCSASQTSSAELSLTTRL
jgi:hypothetical protein